MSDLTISRFASIISSLFTVCLFSFPAYAQYGGGTGEPNDPYLIYTADQLNAIGAEPNDWNRHFKLMNDIDLNNYVGTRFNSIGNSRKRFTGRFNGNGHLIRNLVITGQEPGAVGFFGHVTRGARIEQLGIVDAQVNGIETVGILAGENAGIITACYTTGSVTCVSEPQKTPEQIRAEKEAEEETRKLDVEIARAMEGMDVYFPTHDGPVPER